MGFKGKLFQALEKQFPGAFGHSVGARSPCTRRNCTKKPCIHPLRVGILDVSIDIFHLKKFSINSANKTQRTTVMTVPTLGETFVQAVIDALRSNNLDCYVLAADIPSLVPPEKSGEWRKRNKATASNTERVFREFKGEKIKPGTRLKPLEGEAKAEYESWKEKISIHWVTFPSESSSSSTSTTVTDELLEAEDNLYGETKGEGEGKTTSTGGRVVPYPPEARLTLSGIESPKEEESSPVVDVSRLRCSRHMRRSLWEIVAHYLKATNWDTIIPYSKKCILFDYEEGGPWLIYGDGQHEKLTQLAHPFGEADLQIGFYLQYFRECSFVRIESADSDVIVIALNWLQRHTESRRSTPLPLVYFQRSTPSTGGPFQATKLKIAKSHINLNLMLEEMNRRHPQLLFAVQTAAMLGGSDYVEKKDVTHQVDKDEILDWAFDPDNPLLTLFSNGANIAGLLNFVQCKALALESLVGSVTSTPLSLQVSASPFVSEEASRGIIKDTTQHPLQRFGHCIYLLKEWTSKLPPKKPTFDKKTGQAKERKKKSQATHRATREGLEHLIFHLEYINPNWRNITSHAEEHYPVTHLPRAGPTQTSTSYPTTTTTNTTSTSSSSSLSSSAYSSHSSISSYSSSSSTVYYY